MWGRFLGGLIFFAVGCVHFAVLVDEIFSDRNGTVIAVTSFVTIVGLVFAIRLNRKGLLLASWIAGGVFAALALTGH